MAARLNTKFILLVVVTVVVAVGIIAGLTVLRIGTDATKNIAEGDAMMAEGHYNRALAAYGRAAAKEPTNLEYLELVESALTKIVPETSVETRERLSLYRTILDRRTSIASQDGRSYVPYINYLYTIARIENSPAAWRELEVVGERMWNQVDTADPLRLDGKLYRAVAAIGRFSILSDREREEAITDLREVIEARPNDDLAHATLVRALGLVARQVRLASRPQEFIARAQRDVDEALAAAVAAVPQGPRVATTELTLLLEARLANDERVTIDRLDAVSTRLAMTAESVDDPLLMAEIVGALGEVADPRSVRRAVRVADELRERSPDSLMTQWVALLAMERARELDRVASIAAEILAAPYPPVGIESALRPSARAAAAEILFDVAFQRLESADDSATRDERLTEARRALDRLREERLGAAQDAQNDPMTLRAEGRMHLATGRYADALARFEQILRLEGTSTRDHQTLFLAASAALRSGDFGLARTRISQALQILPRVPVYMAVKAQAELGLGNLEQARRDIALASEFDPDSRFVQSVRSTIESSDDDVVTSLRDAQRLLLSGDTDASRSALERLAERAPTDLRVARQRARLEAIVGDREAAAELARAGLRIDPDDADLQQLLILAEETDPVEAIIGAARVALPDEHARPMSIYLALVREAQLLEFRAAERRNRGNQQGAEADLATVTRLKAAAEEQRGRAAELDPPDPRYISLIFDEAMVASDFARARQIVAAERERAEPIMTSSNLVRMEIRTLVGEAEQIGRTDAVERRERLAAATLMAMEARDRNPESTELHLLVGELQGFLGNVEEAVSAYERAYAQRPTDLRVVELYAEALQRAGSRSRLLELLRQVSRLPNITPTLRDAWLDAEALYGSPRVALLERRNRWRSAPGDTSNALRLVQLLIQLVPSREVMVDAEGRHRFSEAQWSGLAQPQQREALETLRRQWLDEATRIADSITVTPSNRFQIAGTRAELLRRRGDARGGEQLLRNAINAAGDGADAGMWLSLGNYLTNVGRADEAEEAFQEALRLQSPRREADRAMVDNRLAQNRLDDAIKHLDAVIRTNPDRGGHLRLVELLQRADRIDDAEAELSKVIDRFGISPDTLMVQSLLVGNRAAKATGEQAMALREEQRALLRRAADLDSSNPTPLAAQAEVVIAIWEQKPDRDPRDSELNEAIRLLDRAIALRANHWPSVRMKAIILGRRNDLTPARAELDRFLQLSPFNDEARTMLIELWQASGDLGRAIQVAENAVDRNPMDGRWLVALGDLRKEANDRAGAITAYRRALEVDANLTPDRLVMMLMEPDREGRRDFTAVIQLLEGNRSVLDRSAFLRAAYGAALVATNQRDRGFEQLRRSHGEYRAIIARNPNAMRALGGWYDQLSIVFPPTRMHDLEGFVREFVDVDTSIGDLQAIGVRWVRSGPDGRSRGLELLERADELSKGGAPIVRSGVLFDLGVAYLVADRCQDAVRMFAEGVELDPTNASNLNNLAYLSVTCLGEPAAGLPHIERALALSPNRAEFHDTHGTILARLGRNSRAEQAFLESLKIAPSAGTHVKLAALLVDMNRQVDARQQLDRAAALDPRVRDDTQYRAVTARLNP